MWYLTPLSDTNSFWHRRHLYFPATKLPCFKDRKRIRGKFRKTYLGFVQGLWVMNGGVYLTRNHGEWSNMVEEFMRNSWDALSTTHLFWAALRQHPPCHDTTWHSPSLCSKTRFLVLLSWLFFASHLAYLDSPPIIKVPKFTRGTRFHPLHGEPWWQTVPWKSRMRRISSIVLSLRTQKPASRWCSPKHCYKKPTEMPTPPLVPHTETFLSPPKAACFMVLMLSEQILLNGTGKWQHFPWLMGGRIPGSPWKRFREMSSY